MKPKKVAFLLNEFPTLTETFILNQIIFLIQKGIELHIFSLYPGNFENLHEQYRGYGLDKKVTYIANIPKHWFGRVKEAGQFLMRDGFWENRTVLFKCLNPFIFGFSGLKLTHLLYYSRINRMQQYALVHVHFGNMGALFSKYVELGLFKKQPFLVSFHGYDLVPKSGEENKKLYRSMFQLANIFTVNSLYTQELLENVDQSLSSRIRLLPESLDTSLFDNEKDNLIEREDYRLVYIGRLVDWKGADRAIDIMERIIGQYGITNIELVIIGKGPLQLEIEKAINENGLQKHVRLLGGIDQSKIKAILSQTDIFVYTGREQPETGRAENQGLVLMEAQAMGVPVVAFDVGGVGEGILDQKTGVLVSSEDVDAFAGQVVCLLKDKEKRITMGILAKQHVKTKYDIQILGNQLLDIYEEVLT